MQSMCLYYMVVVHIQTRQKGRPEDVQMTARVTRRNAIKKNLGLILRFYFQHFHLLGQHMGVLTNPCRNVAPCSPTCLPVGRSHKMMTISKTEDFFP